MSGLPFVAAAVSLESRSTVTSRAGLTRSKARCVPSNCRATCGIEGTHRLRLRAAERVQQRAPKPIPFTQLQAARPRGPGRRASGLGEYRWTGLPWLLRDCQDEARAQGLGPRHRAAGQREPAVPGTCQDSAGAWGRAQSLPGWADPGRDALRRRLTGVAEVLPRSHPPPTGDSRPGAAHGPPLRLEVALSRHSDIGCARGHPGPIRTGGSRRAGGLTSVRVPGRKGFSVLAAPHRWRALPGPRRQPAHAGRDPATPCGVEGRIVDTVPEPSVARLEHADRVLLAPLPRLTVGVLAGPEKIVVAPRQLDRGRDMVHPDPGAVPPDRLMDARHQHPLRPEHGLSGSVRADVPVEVVESAAPC